jgi:CRISPR-associated protein Cas2
MGEAKLWYLIAYDVRDAKRWRKVYALVRGFGTRLQYSVFRCKLSARQLEQLRWELEKRLDKEDSLLLVGLCNGCVERITVKNRPEVWDVQEDKFRIV